MSVDRNQLTREELDRLLTWSGERLVALHKLDAQESLMEEVNRFTDVNRLIIYYRQAQEIIRCYEAEDHRERNRRSRKRRHEILWWLPW